jgi:hypothetical protein
LNIGSPISPGVNVLTRDFSKVPWSSFVFMLFCAMLFMVYDFELNPLLEDALMRDKFDATIILCFPKF